jgi:hypothetical protein
MELHEATGRKKMIEDAQADLEKMVGPQALPTVPQVPRLGGLLGRLAREIGAKAPGQIDAAKVQQELNGIRFGLRCMMGNREAGYRARKNIPIPDSEIDPRADSTLTLIMNVFQFVRAAEDVIVRHGLDGEYKAQVAHLQAAVAAGLPQPTTVELEALQKMLGRMGKGADDGEGGVQLSDAGGEGERAVGAEGVPDHRGETAG